MSQVIENRVKGWEVMLFILAWLFTLLVQGAIPFISIPTLGQAVWTTGFSQSFLNESVFAVYARNIGAPEPAAMVFGLAGAWPTAVFMKLGLHPSDAYSSMIALWMSVAFFSAYGIGRFFSVRPSLSILGAISWLSMPIIWNHAGFSMLSTGIGLLPFYFLAGLHLFLTKTQDIPDKLKDAKSIFSYLAVCLVSIFMDGYSFMMFAVGVSLFGTWLFASEARRRKRMIWFSFPVHLFCLGFAYLLYVFYIGKPQFEKWPIEFFRAWGVDITFILAPTKGIHWLPDLFGWSVPRSQDDYFGDASVWMTSFSIPVIIGSIWAVLYVSGRKYIAVGLILVSAFGFYMALGPSLKVNSVKPMGHKVDHLMEEKYAMVPTGSEILSEHLPGFNNMRASYRWGALGVFGAWAILILAMSSGNKKAISTTAAVLVGVVTILNLPNLSKKFNSGIYNRGMFLRLDSELVNGMKEVVSRHERVAFLPWRNDFLVNYIASRLDVVSYNIGGDKNLKQARLNWPDTLRQFPSGIVDDGFADRTLLLLARNEVDVVILPYIDMLWAAHNWPYPIQFKESLRQSEAQLKSSGFVHVESRMFYAVVRLKPEFLRLKQQGNLEDVIKKKSGIKSLSARPLVGLNNITARKSKDDVIIYPSCTNLNFKTDVRLNLLSGGIDSASRTATLVVEIKNTGKTRLDSQIEQAGYVTVALRQGEPGTQNFLECDRRHLLSEALIPGSATTMKLVYSLPPESTLDNWELDMVSEGVYWFSSRGIKSCPIPLN